MACVGLIGWCLVRASIEKVGHSGVMAVWVLCERIELSAQNLVCDGCRWVAAEGCSVGVSASVW